MAGAVEEQDLTAAAARAATGDLAPQAFSKVFLSSEIFCQRPERPGFPALGAPPDGLIPAFSSPEQLAAFAGECDWFCTTGTDLLSLLPPGFRLLLDPAAPHAMRIDPAAWEARPRLHIGTAEALNRMRDPENQRFTAETEILVIRQEQALRKFLRSPGAAQSGIGWPVPGMALVRSGEKMRELVESARERGYSRHGRGLDLDAASYAVFPYLPEDSPEESWVCLVAAFSHSLALKGGQQPTCTFARLDISVGDFKSLPRASRKERDQLLHWFVWLAHKF